MFDSHAAIASLVTKLDASEQVGLVAGLVFFLALAYLILRSQQSEHHASLNGRAKASAWKARSHNDDTSRDGVRGLLGIGQDMERGRRNTVWVRAGLLLFALAAVGGFVWVALLRPA